MSIEQLSIAWHRFGLGARPGDLAPSSAAPVTVLLEEVSDASAPAALAGLPGTPALYADYVAQQMERKAARLAGKGPQGRATRDMADAAPMMAPSTRKPSAATSMSLQPADAMVQTDKATSDAGAMAAPGDMRAKANNPVHDAMIDEVGARLKLARSARIGFGERLALFWSNHFTVAGTNGQARILCGAFEREAIRPHLTGSFKDMLEAAENHPAMLLYLNNERSIGPNSPAGQRQGKGLNENLAREILELHTLGVDGGYSQADVTSFAAAITGWSVVGGKNPEGLLGSFVFRPRAHEPGAKTVLARSYPDEGRLQGQSILADLARHRATGPHIAMKLVRHFIADEPPKAAVAAVAKAFETSGGELMPVYEALLKCEGAMSRPFTKLRPPHEYGIAALRALEIDFEPRRFVRAMTVLGQTPYMAPSPQGWPDDSKAWLAPDAIGKRLEFASLLAQPASQVKPLERAKAVLGPLLSEETASAIERAESSHQALALLLMAPEFQRR